MTVGDWILFGLCVLLILLFAAGFVVWVFAPKWTRDEREHPPRAERVALMQRLRKESGYDPSLPRDPK